MHLIHLGLDRLFKYLFHLDIEQYRGKICVGPVDLCWELIASPIWYWSQYSRWTIPVDNIKEQNSKQNHTTDKLLWIYDTYVLYGVESWQSPRMWRTSFYINFT